MALQQQRYLRFLLLIIAVTLTIFIYASYSSTTIITIQSRANINNIITNEEAAQLINFDKNKVNETAITNLKIDNPKVQLKSEPEANTSCCSSTYLNTSHSHQVTNVLKNLSSNFLIKNVTTKSTTYNILQVSIAKKQKNISIPLIQHKKSTPINQLKGKQTSAIYESGHIVPNIQLCPNNGTNLSLLILIASAPSHQNARLAVRQTWGFYKARSDTQIAFVLGRTQNNTIENLLKAENILYNDLIRGHFIDSYNNLTLKTISSLEWIDTYCSNVKFVLKTDDDMFINIPKLLGFIEKHKNDKKRIFGRLAKNWKPIRNKKSKYYISLNDYKESTFPDFTTGPAYLLTSDIIHSLYINSLKETYLKLEDVYITGIIAKLLNIKRIHVNEFLNRLTVFNVCNIRQAISIHMVKINEQFDLWKKLLDPTTRCK